MPLADFEFVEILSLPPKCCVIDVCPLLCFSYSRKIFYSVDHSFCEE